MILKIILGSGGRSLISYLSQIQKAPTHHPQNDPKIYDKLHLANPDFDPNRRIQPTASINQLPHLSQLNVVHKPRTDADHSRAGQGIGEVFLQSHARDDLVGGPAIDAAGLRRPSHRPGPAPAQKSGGRRLEKPSAPPTFSTFAGTTPRQISAEFAALRKLKPNLGKAVGHLILSPGPEDRTLSKEEWKQALDLALAEHGASEAQHAAYLHFDTDHPHLHVFFSRITPTGQVISDSNSYQKNRSATQKITQELKLTPLPKTQNPADAAQADRQAVGNASRRAERRGTPDPGRINAQSVRDAVGEARSLDHLKSLLKDKNTEAEFQRRGPSSEVFGWKLRVIGSEEWLKASNLAKDLSWPKIAHRFETEAQIENRADGRAPAKEQEDRRPAMIRSSLQPRQKLDLGLPKTTSNIAQADIGPVSKVMLLIGAAAFKLSAAAIEALMNFLKWLLRKFGLMLAPAQPGGAQSQTALPFEPRYLDVESRVVPEPVISDATNNIATAAEQLLQVADALEKNDPDLLPPGQGREELAAALVAEQSPFSFLPADDKTVDIQAPPENKQDGLEELFSASKSPFFRELDKLIDDALAALDRAINAQQEAESNADRATKEVADEVKFAKVRFNDAAQNLTAGKNHYVAEKEAVPKLLRFAFPSAEKALAKEFAAVELAKTALVKAEKNHPPSVPEHLSVALLQARIGSVRAAELAVNEQKKMLATLKNGPAELFKLATSRVNSFAAQVTLLSHLPSTTQAEISLKSGFDAMKQIAYKRQEIEETARREVERALDDSSQKHVPRIDSADDEAPGR